MKKMIGILLALILALAALTPVLAEKKDLTVEELGLTMNGLEYIIDAKGYAFLPPANIESRSPYVAALLVQEILIPKDTLLDYQDAQNAGTEYPDGQAVLEGISALDCYVAGVFVTDGTEDSIRKAVDGLENETLTKLGAVDGYTLYYTLYDYSYIEKNYTELSAKYPDSYPADALADWKAEISAIQQGFEADLKSAVLKAPVDKMAALVGSVISFETTDTEGNAVTSAELFAANQITMINVWGTWCPHCVDEMGELAKIHKRIQEKGCGILGLEYEHYWDDGILQASKEMISENQITYPNAVYPAGNELMQKVCSDGYPTSVFVDSEGKILAAPIAGAYVDKYEKVLDQLLNGETVSVTKDARAVANSEKAFRAIVCDETGPVQGVLVKFCDDTSCTADMTNADGIVSFNLPEGHEYHVNVLTVPAGYEPFLETLTTQTTYCDTYITLKKAQ